MQTSSQYPGLEISRKTCMVEQPCARNAWAVQQLPRTHNHVLSVVQMPVTSSLSYRWLEDAVTDWQTSQGARMHMDGLAGYTPKQVRTWEERTSCLCSRTTIMSQPSVPSPLSLETLPCLICPQVEEVKLVLRLLPIFAATVLYW